MQKSSFLGMALVMALCGLVSGCFDDSDKAPAQSGPMAPPVSVFNVEKKDTPWDQEFQAQASGSRSVEVRARVEAVIEQRLYREGAYVEKGQQLFQLERDQYETRVAMAEAQFQNAEREWRRVRPLYEKNAVSQKERDAAQAAYESAKAELRQAEINLDYCQVTSPVAGYSSKEIYTPGNLVSNNSLLTYVNQTEPMYIDFSIAAPTRMQREDMERAGQLRFPPDGKYVAHLRMLDGRMYNRDGEVTFIDTQVQSGTGVIQARAVFENPDGAIMPGQYVRLYMEGDVLVDAILIPQRCVVHTAAGDSVMLVGQDDTVSMAPVTVAATVGQSYLISSGLEGGERIISDGIIKARPGGKVRVVADDEHISAPAGAQKAPEQTQTETKPEGSQQ